MEITIAIDAMGGDIGAKVTVPAAAIALERYPNIRLILVGQREILEQQLRQVKSGAGRELLHKVAAAKNRDSALSSVSTNWSERIEIHDASEVVTMDESPTKALRFKKDSSMRVAVNLVKEGVAQACVSAGNTGALMATAHYVLKTLPGIDRPAIVAYFPTVIPDKEVHVLDLGANVDSTAEHLYQFAIMGSIMTKAVDGIERPKVGLLNIGEEEIKGNEQVKRAAELLSKSKELNYIGYVEGDDIFKGEADVVVCDGFIGNVALKTSEGLVKLIATYLKRAFMRNWFTKLVALIARPILKRFARQLDPGLRNGASLIGLRSIVIKSHGGANEAAFANAIGEAVREVANNIPQKIQQEISAFF